MALGHIGLYRFPIEKYLVTKPKKILKYIQIYTNIYKIYKITKDDFVDRDGNCKSRSSKWTAVASVERVGKVEPGKVESSKVEAGKVELVGKTRKKISLKIAAAESKDRSA